MKDISVDAVAPPIDPGRLDALATAAALRIVEKWHKAGERGVAPAPSDDEFRVAVALLSRGWQAISTAPKDGRDVILCGDPKRYGRPVRVDHWDGVNGCWFRSRYSSPPDTFIGWQPLPSPPSEV